MREFWCLRKPKKHSKEPRGSMAPSLRTTALAKKCMQHTTNSKMCIVKAVQWQGYLMMLQMVRGAVLK